MNIEINHLNKSYNGQLVLNDFSASFQKSCVTCLLGPSGCGKTTLFNILLGLQKPDSGEVHGLGNEKISAVFQENRLCKRLNAVKNVSIVCDKTKVSKQQIISLLNTIGLDELSIRKPVTELSGGMQRRVAIARAILVDADIFFMDEPFKGLDLETKRITVDLVREKIKDKTAIVVTHDLQEVSMLQADMISMS